MLKILTWFYFEDAFFANFRRILKYPVADLVKMMFNLVNNVEKIIDAVKLYISCAIWKLEQEEIGSRLHTMSLKLQLQKHYSTFVISVIWDRAQKNEQFYSILSYVYLRLKVL